MSFDRGRFPALPPWWPRNPSPQPEASTSPSQALEPGGASQPDTSSAGTGPSNQPTARSRPPKRRSQSISPPRGYVPPPRDHTPPLPTTQIPDPPAGLKERQAIVDGYLASLAQRRNDSNIPFKLLSEAATTMTRQLLSQREWLNPNARLRLSLPSWLVEDAADAQDHLLRRMRFTGWVNRGAETQPQEWRDGVCVGGPGNAVRQQALRKRVDVSPFGFGQW